jgi:hypothetical protein
MEGVPGKVMGRGDYRVKAQGRKGAAAQRQEAGR